ncbi:response regulator [Paraburkholderia sp. ZP32-5]|uniref:response regulator n=1 Tax=Paraburkholderia sp. ZP32-5 TaxID=2883245 RepID=UPI001F1CFA4D|nr:response regulator [Paraburkholderia sp. ZP32-5]
MKSRLLVSVVDDDESVRESLPDLVQELGFEVRAFASGEAFLCSNVLETTRCLILDVMMPGMSGHELIAQLRARNVTIPIVYITAYQDDGLRCQLLAEGAVACLYKPFSDVELLDALTAAIAKRTT